MASKCLCGCGNPVNPGRSYVHGHNQKKHVNVKHAVNPVAHKVKHRMKHKRSSTVATWHAKARVLKELVKRREKLDGLIELLRAFL